MKLISLLTICLVTITFATTAQTTINITTSHTALSLQTDADSSLLLAYFGPKLGSNAEYAYIHGLDKFKPGNDDLLNKHEAYTAAGSLHLLEPALALTHSNGDKSTALHYVSHTVNRIDDNQTLTAIRLEDPVYHLQVTLYYQSYSREDVIEAWTVIQHHEKGNVVLNKYASANLTLGAQAFYLKSHHSGWGREMNAYEAALPPGILTLDSKLGARANLLQSSSFMVSLNHPATEETGEVIAGTLAWSGNFRIDFETFDENYLRITAGINNYASNYTLAPGQAFVTPKFIFTYSAQGKGAASRHLQQWARNYQLLNGQGERSTLLNNWETTYFDFDEAKLNALLHDTKKLGVDVFLLDDGWFGNKYPRNNDKGGLGDWQPNKQKLKNGFTALSKEASATDVKFGIWIEPEMVNPRSELYEKHPDWVIREPGRKEYYMRNQLVLDLANPAVQDFIYRTVDGLFNDIPALAFIKWDCNSLIYNAHSPYLKNQDHFYIEYVQGFYHILEKIRARHPQVPMMLCAGGGSRVDYGALKYFTECWPSDNTNAFDRIFIQWEYSYYFPSIALDNHVTDMGKQPIKFKTDVAMMGKLGFDIRVNELTPQDLQFCQQAVQTYNSIKDIVWHGEQYRLQDPYKEKTASMAYVSSDKTQAIVFNYFVATTFSTTIGLPIKMQGLDPAKQYRIEEINLYPGTISPINNAPTYSGDFLMKVGFNPEVSARRSSVVLRISAM
ncbi:alpha-galactosidase [Chitinophaga vietnamensis]|uniref:alpha-galactosidase n=1 Tax=Chitinophaga vietnamensis TaxID=2593957 RepID=UPI001177A245|nr:alpha-galactosidase [Chitinophaga vietnamensis]